MKVVLLAHIRAVDEFSRKFKESSPPVMVSVIHTLRVSGTNPYVSHTTGSKMANTMQYGSCSLRIFQIGQTVIAVEI